MVVQVGEHAGAHRRGAPARDPSLQGGPGGRRDRDPRRRSASTLRVDARRGRPKPTRRPEIGDPTTTLAVMSMQPEVVEEQIPPQGHVKVVYLGPVAPHWEVHGIFGDGRMIDEFRQRARRPAPAPAAARPAVPPQPRAGRPRRRARAPHPRVGPRLRRRDPERRRRRSSRRRVDAGRRVLAGHHEAHPLGDRHRVVGDALVVPADQRHLHREEHRGLVAAVARRGCGGRGSS